MPIGVQTEQCHILKCYKEVEVYMSHVMRKPVYAIGEQQRHRSACASAQSDQCLVVRCLDSITILAIAEITRL